MVCREYMVDRHCVWCSMVGSVKWDNIQNESHSYIKEKGTEKYMCWVARVKNSVFLVRHMYPAMNVRESVGKHAKPAMRPRKFATHKNTQALVKTSEYRSLSNRF